MFNFETPKITEIYTELLARRDAEFPEYTTRDKRDFGVMLIWLFAVIVKFFADHVNRLFRNMFLTTATDRQLLVENAIERGCFPRGVISSRQLLTFTSTQTVTIPQGFQVKTKGGIVFETDVECHIEGAGTGQVYATQGKRKVDTFVSDGTPHQRFQLTYTPYVDGSVQISVTGQGAFTPVVDIVLADPVDQCFTIYADGVGKGTVIFGNGTNGVIPTNGATITVTYLVGVGVAGNVEDGTITELVQSLAGISEVTNARTANTVSTSAYVPGDVTLTVESTRAFAQHGQAYIEGYPFQYTGKTATQFTGVSGLDMPYGTGATVSVVTSGLIQGQDLETDEDIRYKAIMHSRTQTRIVSEEDYQAFVLSHPSVAWANAYTVGNIIHVLGLGVDGQPLTAPIKADLTTQINKKNIPVIQYAIVDPEMVNVDVAVEIELANGAVFDGATVLQTSPLVYVGAKQNVATAISDYLSPLSSAQRFSQGISRDITLFGLYEALSHLPLPQVKNARIINLSTNRTAAGTIAVSAGSALLTGTGTDFTTLEVGDILRVLGSTQGNDAYIKVLDVQSSTAAIVSKTFEATESGLHFYKASLSDIRLTGIQVPQPGSILVMDTAHPLWQEPSGGVVMYPSQKFLRPRLAE